MIVHSKEAIRIHIREMINESIDFNHIENMNKSFPELEADSLDIVEFIMQLEDDFCTEISDEAANTLWHKSIEEWAEYCYANQNSICE